jgi:hypothetical protein
MKSLAVDRIADPVQFPSESGGRDPDGVRGDVIEVVRGDSSS